jgi:glycosyltransferase involved in cell wall biosynthesis
MAPPPAARGGGASTAAGTAAGAVPAPAPFPGHTGAVAGIFGFLNPGLDYGSAFELAEAMAPRLALLLLGGDRPGHAMAPALEAEIRRRGLSGRVRISGYLPEAELAARLAGCDFFLCPMRFKSSTASVLRLFRQGRPILVPDLPLTRYLAEAGAPIRLYSGAGDLRALAEAAAEGRLEPVPDRYPWDVAKVAEAYLEAMLGPV